MNRINEGIEEISEDLFFVAGGPAMRKLRVQAELLAKVNVPVLILGESGSGKEIAARLIHKLSARASCRFLKVNCAALPRDLLESELFGYERGAFTGATRNRRGKFELCDKGTILLDEIAEMPASLQAKLLHVLQDRQFFRLGGDTTIAVDVRILAATNMNVEQALRDNTFREDLYYRLSAFTLHLPPLRDRKEEIPLLMDHFMKLMARNYGLNPRPFSPALLHACQNHSWPGNLRELENVVKRYLVMGDEFIEFSDFASKLESHSEPVSWPDPATEKGSDGSENGEPPDLANLKILVRNLKGEAERNAIATTLEKTQWNRKAAARQLGISYRGLLYKIHEYQLAPPVGYIPTLPTNGVGKRKGKEQ